MNRYLLHLHSNDNREKERAKDIAELLKVVSSFNIDTEPDASRVISVFVKYLNKYGWDLSASDKAEREAMFERGMATERGRLKIIEALSERNKDNE